MPPTPDPAHDLVQALRRHPRYAANIVAFVEQPARAARHADWPEAVLPTVVEAATHLGFDRLFSHQARAISAVLAGLDVVLASGTASGKSLAYVVPALQYLALRPEARVLMLFPTKALARDQLSALRTWDAALPQLDAAPAAYDADTPQAARPHARRRSRIILTNPDMLHAGILPRHPDWAALFRGLELVVLDEAHVYRGVFGSHVANVVRRLRRIAHHYGANPRFVLTSATIGNPGELGRALLGGQAEVIQDDGSPAAARSFVLYNPPLVDAVLGIRRSVLLEAESLAHHFASGGVQTIVFAQSRLAAELIVRYLADAMGTAPGGTCTESVRGYRAGYTAGERREIEAQLRNGRVRAVVATNALELGIDIGRLDACVIAGYPGSIASVRQQAGRAGRRSGHGAVVLVASAAPIDQFLARHPDYLLGGSPEHARLDPDNLLVLLDHVRCAACELPFSDAEAARPFGDGDADGGAAGVRDQDPGSRDLGARAAAGPPVDELLAILAAKGDVRRSGSTWFWIGAPGPAADVGLRSSGPDVVTIVTGVDASQGDAAGGQDVLGTVDRWAAPSTVHAGAVYLHDGRSFEVVDLDWDAARAYVRPVDGSEYTRASARNDLTPLMIGAERQAIGACVFHGELEVRRRVTGYRRIRLRTHETLGWGHVDLPEQVHVAGAYWFALSDHAIESLRRMGHWQVDSSAERGPDWPEQRAQALERDGHRCRLCNAPEREGRSHDVHHIRPFLSFGWVPGENDRHRQANDQDNLITLCHQCHVIAERALGLHAALGGLGHALRHMAGLFLMCDVRDIDVSAEAHASWTGRPTVAVYERSAGGVGFGPALYDRHEELLAACRELIAGCGCAAGCPSCVGPVDENGPDAKAQALAVLGSLSEPADG